MYKGKLLKRKSSLHETPNHGRHDPVSAKLKGTLHEGTPYMRPSTLMGPANEVTRQ